MWPLHSYVDWRELIAPGLLVIAGVLSLGLSGGQIVRCIRRGSSDDVTIVGWLCGAASQGCLVAVVVVTNSSFWLGLWEGAGMLEYLAAAWIAWHYRSHPAAHLDTAERSETESVPARRD